MEQLSVARRRVRKAGPRALTYSLTTDGPPGENILVNCRKSANRSIKTPNGRVTGELVVKGGSPTTLDPALLVQGWYAVRTTTMCFVQQLNPRDAKHADPIASGVMLMPHEELDIYVERSNVDGVLAVVLCPPEGVPQGCVDVTNTACVEGVAVLTVNRLDSIVPTSETGDNASAKVASPAPATDQECS